MTSPNPDNAAIRDLEEAVSDAPTPLRPLDSGAATPAATRWLRR